MVSHIATRAERYLGCPESNNRARYVLDEEEATTAERLPKLAAVNDRLEMVGTTGFEPATSRTPSVRATRLRHVPFALNSTTTIQDLLFLLVSCSSNDNSSRSSEASCFKPCRSSAVREGTARV